MRIEHIPRFKRAFKKLPRNIQQIAWRKIEIFSQTQFHPSLKTHKLAVEDLWAFSVDFKHRIVFQFVDDYIVLVNIGDHSIYRNIS